MMRYREIKIEFENSLSFVKLLDKRNPLVREKCGEKIGDELQEVRKQLEEMAYLCLDLARKLKMK